MRQSSACWTNRVREEQNCSSSLTGPQASKRTTAEHRASRAKAARSQDAPARASATLRLHHPVMLRRAGAVVSVVGTIAVDRLDSRSATPPGLPLSVRAWQQG